MTYNYLKNVTEDVLDYITNEYDEDDLRAKLEDREKFEQELNDDLWAVDSVTGNGSGSYFFNRYKAEEALMHNLDLLAEAIDEFGGCIDVLKNGAEACDVTIRCYLLNQAICAALDVIEEELNEQDA